MQILNGKNLVKQDFSDNNIVNKIIKSVENSTDFIILLTL